VDRFEKSAAIDAVLLERKPGRRVVKPLVGPRTPNINPLTRDKCPWMLVLTKRAAMRRREFITFLGAAASWPLTARAQPSADLPEFGFLYPGPAQAADARAKIIWDGLKEYGYVEGKNLALVSRSADNDPDQITKFATELAQRHVRAILAIGPSAVRAARAVTSTIPIVALDLETDPVSTGLTASLAHPGGNVTGLFFDFPEFTGKWLQLLTEAIPGLSHVAVFWDPTTGPVQVEEAKAAAASQGVRLEIITVHNAAGLKDAFAEAYHEQVQGVVVLSSPLFSAIIGSKPVADAATEYWLPAISLFPEFAQFGGLMGYGPSITDLYLQAGTLVGRILHGDNPADLPVERPSRFRLVINLKTAKSLGVTIPPSLLIRADELIE
jgi:putative tryptophan/tyrosine transport system substrate-binding protein